jgi:hypothetical protein
MVRQALSLGGLEAGLDQRLKNIWHWGTAMLISGFLKTLRQFFESVSHKSHKKVLKLGKRKYQLYCVILFILSYYILCGGGVL